MDKKLTVSASPHITNKHNSTRRIMIDVCIALIPCVIASIYFFGWHVLLNVVICMASCFGAETLYNLIYKGFNKENAKNTSALDCSCFVTGILIALNVPATAVVSGWDFNFYSDGFRTGGADIIFSLDILIMCIIGSIFAIAVIKMLFGGIGKNFANPAASARVFLFVCFGLSAVGVGLSASSGATTLLSASSGATWLSDGVSTADSSTLFNLFIGKHGSAAVGETCIIAILIGYIYLSIRKVIDFRIPLIGMATFFVLSIIFDGLIASSLSGSDIFTNALANLMAGGFMFGLVFMATDYSTTPNTFIGNVIFIAGYALLTIVIRCFASWPEGASFAIIIMNIITPLINRYIYPKPFGFEKVAKAKKSKKGVAKAG